MLNSKIKLVSLVLSVALVGSVLSGCKTTASPSPSASADVNKPITFKFFDKNTGDAFTDDVAKEITKKTGVTLELQQPTGDPLEKLNLMLASGDYPDFVLMDRSNDIVSKYISAGALVPLDDLIKKEGPNVTKMYGETLKKIRYQDGKNYYLSNWYGADSEPVFGVLMRQDIVKELAGDKATNGQPFTQDEFVKLLKDYKAKYPTVNGKATLPLTFQSDNQGGILGVLKGMYGIKTYTTINGELKYDARDSKYVDMIKFANSLYTQGLLDKEWYINKKQLWQEKLSNGYTFATTGAYWDTNDANTALRTNVNKDAQFIAYKVLAAGVDAKATSFGGRSSLGWDAIGITKNCKDQDRAMKFMDFMVSEEGQYLMMWGIQGTTWNTTDGKHTPMGDIVKNFKDNWTDTVKKTGVRHWTWFIKNGLGTDGTPYDLAAKYQKDDITTAAYKNLTDTYWDTAEFDALTPAGGTPEALINQKVTDILNQALPKMISSASEADAVTAYKKMIADMDAAGLAKVEKIINDNYAKRKGLWK